MNRRLTNLFTAFIAILIVGPAACAVEPPVDISLAPTIDIEATIEATIGDRLDEELKISKQRTLTTNLDAISEATPESIISVATPVSIPTPTPILLTIPTRTIVPIDYKSYSSIEKTTPVVSPTPQLQTSMTASDRFARGKTFYREKQYAHAIAEFSQAIALAPKYRESYWYIGKTYYILGEYQKAIKSFETATQIGPPKTRIYVEHGKALVASDRIENGIKIYTKATKLNPRESTAFHHRAEAYRQIGQVKNSNEDYRKACEISDKYCSQLSELRVCTEKQFDGAYVLWGTASGARITAWLDGEKIDETMPGGARKVDAPYSLPLSMCDREGSSLIGQLVEFKLDNKWANQTAVITGIAKERLDLSVD